jgi:hypothetical protein
MSTATVYIPAAETANDVRWDIVAAALRAAGVTDIRRPSPPVQNFHPRHARPAIISTMEV